MRVISKSNMVTRHISVGKVSPKSVADITDFDFAAP